ncbi:translation initiation factor 2 [Streptomyces luteolus]|uniref:Translation initiation factor 2 n=1 Tax=Streptomyces luteolus TaxID=3043615 RepID=A0ABT6STD3_9ACTN|nr:translation initiation factor 2 [Streptomyces sp. B-S-A12]MDI3418480.1 translation initiation factor 2 [Streptomyces sp. B-S-A12]
MSPDDTEEPALTCENTPPRGPLPDRIDATGDGRRATGDGRRATGDGRRATGDGRRATGDGRRTTDDGRRTTDEHRVVLLAARSAVALNRLLDAAPALAGDERITRLFTLVPGSEFGADALAAIDTVGGRLVPWEEARTRTFDLIVAASPKGELELLRGRHVLLPHGAGFNKAIPYEGSADSASGLDPAFLQRTRTDGAAPMALHALAHPDQLDRLAATDAQAARVAKVVGDPTLDRFLASRSLRERYRNALGTGFRTLIALASTWGPDSLLRHHPGLPALLAAHLPYDSYQLALIVHPNEWSRLGAYELAERLAPALDAGLVLARPREEWGSVLVAADALITDHGSAALYFAAAAPASERPVVGVHDPAYGDRTSSELIPGSPMAVLLGRTPKLRLDDTASPADTLREVESALRAYDPGVGLAAAASAFACRGEATARLRKELYALLGLTPPPTPCPSAPPRPLPVPLSGPNAVPPRAPNAFDVHAEITEAREAPASASAPAPAPATVSLTRHPAGLGPAGHHLAAEYGAAGEPQVRSAGLLYRRASAPAAPDLAWPAEGWLLHALDSYPGCRTAAVLLPTGACLLRTRAHEQTYAVEAGPHAEDGGRIARIDPAVAASAVHASPDGPAATRELNCLVGKRQFPLRIRPATPTERSQTI